VRGLDGGAQVFNLGKLFLIWHSLIQWATFRRPVQIK
jgi:hypothetical protein